MQSNSLDAVDEGSVVEGSPVPTFSAAAFANHTYAVLPSELLIRNASFQVCSTCCLGGDETHGLSLICEPAAGWTACSLLLNEQCVVSFKETLCI